MGRPVTVHGFTAIAVAVGLRLNHDVSRSMNEPVRPRPPFLAIVFLALGLLAPADAQTITPKHSRKFTRFDDCAFVPTSFVDGDSFRLRIGQDEFVFRLYYVDCPETDDRFPDRNAEQAEYFGITDAESLAAGKAAKEYVAGLLTGKALTVFTRWASALGSSRLPRYYGVVEVEGRGLADLLVENGLARLHGMSVNHPGGTKQGKRVKCPAL